MRKHKSHAVGDLCKRGVTLPSWQTLEASLARDAAATPPPSGAVNDTASTDAARALAGDRAKLLTGGADGDALRALVALLSGAVVPDDAAAAAGGARVLDGHWEQRVSLTELTEVRGVGSGVLAVSIVSLDKKKFKLVEVAAC